jgi:hypothetical protein
MLMRKEDENCCWFAYLASLWVADAPVVVPYSVQLVTPLSVICIKSMMSLSNW